MRFIVSVILILIGGVISIRTDWWLNNFVSIAWANEVPTIDSLTVAVTSGGNAIGSIDLNENSTKMVYVHGTYTDNDGCSEVATGGSLNLVLYRSSVSGGASCTRDDANCLRSTTTGYACNYSSLPANTCAGGADISANYECSIPVQFYANRTDAGDYGPDNWVALITATDSTPASGTNTGTTEINTLTALNVSNSIPFGILALGTTSITNTAVEVTNTGNNSSLDFLIYGTAMTCQVGVIDASQIKYSTSSLASYESMYALSSTATYAHAAIPSSVDGGAAVATTTYWKLQLPSSGLAGSCSGIISFIAA